MFKTLFFCPWCDLCQSVKKKLHHSFTFQPQPSSHLSSVQCRTKCRIHPLSLSETAPPSHCLSWPVQLFSPNSTSASLCVCVLIVSVCVWVLPTVSVFDLFLCVCDFYQQCFSPDCSSFDRCAAAKNRSGVRHFPKQHNQHHLQHRHHHPHHHRLWGISVVITTEIQKKVGQLTMTSPCVSNWTTINPTHCWSVTNGLVRRNNQHRCSHYFLTTKKDKEIIMFN